MIYTREGQQAALPKMLWVPQSNIYRQRGIREPEASIQISQMHLFFPPFKSQRHFWQGKRTWNTQRGLKVRREKSRFLLAFTCTSLRELQATSACSLQELQSSIHAAPARGPTWIYLVVEGRDHWLCHQSHLTALSGRWQSLLFILSHLQTRPTQQRLSGYPTADIYLFMGILGFFLSPKLQDMSEV